MKLKRTIAAFIAFSISLGSSHFTGSCYANKMLNVIAADNYNEFTDNGLIYNIYDDHIELVGYTEDIKENVVIPDFINNTPVTIIAEDAFEGLEILKSVTIPETVTEIDDYAFCGCNNLEKIEGMKNVKSIGWASFSVCEKLKELTLPKSLETIGAYAFNECRSLTVITIPDSVTDLGAGAFLECEELVSVKLSDNITELKSDKDESKEPKSYYGTFGHCTKLKEITLPEKLEKIGEYTFDACSSLEKITIPKNVKEIGGGAFQTANVYFGIRMYTSPEEELESNLKEIVVAEGNDNFCCIDGVLYNKDCSTLIQYPLGVYRKEFTIPKSVKVIGKGAFYDLPIQNILFDGDVEEIEENAFAYTKIREIKLPQSLKQIGDKAFLSSSITNIEFPNKLKKIGSNSFAGTSRLESIVIPQNLEEIGTYCFYCSGLKKVTILNPNLRFSCFGEDMMTGTEFCNKSDRTFNGVIYGYTNSSAQKYAEEYNCKFESLGEFTVLTTTSSETSITTSVTTTTQTASTRPKDNTLGDVNNDGKINAVDASSVLSYYAMISTNKEGGFNDNQMAAADVDHDGKINAVDASNILSYYAYVSTTKEEVVPMEQFMKKTA